MGFTDEIFQRATIKGMVDYLLLGTEAEKETGSYEERLDKAYDKFEKIALRDYDGAENELLNAANDLMAETASVYTEIGLRAGFLLAQDLAQTGNGQRQAASVKKDGREGAVDQLPQLALVKCGCDLSRAGSRPVYGWLGVRKGAVASMIRKS